MEDNGKKVIQISLSQFIILIVLLIILICVGVGLYVSALRKSNTESEIQAISEKENSINEVSSKDENIILDKEWIKDNMKLKYPSNWKLTENEDYAEATTIEIPGSDNKTKIYITSSENTGNKTGKEIIEDATNPDYGVPTETMDEGEKNIAGVKAYYKTQSMSYDDGSNVNSTTIILIKDIFVYEFRCTAIRSEYNTYYPTFEKILGTIEFIENNTSKNQNISSSNEEVKYPTSLGAIFSYTNDEINSSVKNKTSDITYVGEPLNSNLYKISDDRKSITVSGKTLKFEKEIYHACVYPIGQGGVDMWAILFKDETVKYTTDYGETMKDGGNHIIDIFPIEYKRDTGDNDIHYMRGTTILVASEYGALTDLRIK